MRHELVGAVHLTGSEATFNAIVFGEHPVRCGEGRIMGLKQWSEMEMSRGKGEGRLVKEKKGQRERERARWVQLLLLSNSSDCCCVCHSSTGGLLTRECLFKTPRCTMLHHAAAWPSLPAQARDC